MGMEERWSGSMKIAFACRRRLVDRDGKHSEAGETSAVGIGEWEPEAENWVRWARTPNHDAYWYYRDSFFDDLVPRSGRRTIEIGCGEGRVARDLMARGHRVTAVDTSHTLLRYAREADPTSSYVLADSARLPFPDGHFDQAVAYNSLQVVADMSRTVHEAARVLSPGGVFCACVSHPATDLGRFVADDPDADFVLRPSYFERRRVEDTLERDGLTVTCRGWTYTLEDYLMAFSDAGFTVEAIREPQPRGTSARYDRWRRIPMFLNVRMVK
jgi:SAM-dependent methyltransferase